MEMKLVVIGGKQAGMEIPVRRPKFLVGRGEECQLRPQSHLVSRKHCAILVEEGSAAIEDFGSTNGTFVNGEKIQQRRELNNGDRIKIGMLELEVRLTAAAADKKKPKVHSVQEAAARTVASTASDDDDEISQWLAEDNNGQSVAPPSDKPAPAKRWSRRFTTRSRARPPTTPPRRCLPTRARRRKKRNRRR